MARHGHDQRIRSPLCHGNPKLWPWHSAQNNLQRAERPLSDSKTHHRYAKWEISTKIEKNLFDLGPLVRGTAPRTLLMVSHQTRYLFPPVIAPVAHLVQPLPPTLGRASLRWASPKALMFGRGAREAITNHSRSTSSQHLPQPASSDLQHSALDSVDDASN